MTTAVLDLSPMIFALDRAPSQFTRLPSGDIRHIDSLHDIHFKWYGDVSVQTDRSVYCDCVGEHNRTVQMRTTYAQRRELRGAARRWIREYWEPLTNPKARAAGQRGQAHQQAFRRSLRRLADDPGDGGRRRLALQTRCDNYGAVKTAIEV
jgi:hypothetical protein